MKNIRTVKKHLASAVRKVNNAIHRVIQPLNLVMGRTEVDNANPPDNSLSSGKHGLFGQPFCVGFPFFELVIFSLSISVYVCMYVQGE